MQRVLRDNQTRILDMGFCAGKDNFPVLKFDVTWSDCKLHDPIGLRFAKRVCFGEELLETVVHRRMRIAAQKAINCLIITGK